MMSGRLNAFQKVMLQWSQLHPYTAAHSYKLAGPLHLGRLQAAIAATCETYGLGRVCLDGDGCTYRHETDASLPIEVLDGGDEPEERLAEHLTRELNCPFQRPADRPFRFSVVALGAEAHWLSVAYDHWVADSVAARLVLRHILGRYLKLAIPENDLPVDLYPGTYRQVFGRRVRGLPLGMSVLRSLRQWNGNRKAWQVGYWSSAQWAVGYQLYRTQPGTVDRLRAFAQASGGTVHDVILAAMARSMIDLMPRRRGRKPQDLALGSIVDSRVEAEADLSQSIGAFLAYYLVRCGADRNASLADLTARIAAQTGPIKRDRRYLDSLVNVQFINAIWPRLPERIKPYFMRRALPMAAGVSNILLRDPWIVENRRQILDFSRAAPTGPTLPLALTPTTLGDEMSIGVTYRLAGFTQEKIDGVMERLLDQLQQPEPAVRGRRGRQAA